MQLLLEIPPTLETLARQATEEAQELKAELTLRTAGVVIERGKDPFQYLWKERGIGVLVDGNVPVRIYDAALLMLECGDPLIPYAELRAEENPSGVGDFAIIMDVYDLPPSPNPSLAKYLRTTSALHFHLAHVIGARSGIGSSQEPPSIQQYDAGEIIINQGDLNDDVFTLVEGEAAALVDDIQVGQIGPDEIFGAMAALAGIPRTATVRATNRCIALRMPKNEFTRLMQARPETVMRILQDMAKALSNMNEKFVQKVRQVR